MCFALRKIVSRVRVLRPAETVYSVKRFMGRRGADISSEEMLVTYPVQGDGGGSVAVTFSACTSATSCASTAGSPPSRR